MLYSFAADTLLIVHLLFIFFVIFGGLLLFKWHGLFSLHLAAVVWGVLVEFNHWICPLTHWENALRRAAGETGYESGFVEYYLVPLIYPTELTNDHQLILGSLVIAINIVIYSWLLLKIRSH